MISSKRSKPIVLLLLLVGVFVLVLLGGLLVKGIYSQKKWQQKDNLHSLSMAINRVEEKLNHIILYTNDPEYFNNDFLQYYKCSLSLEYSNVQEAAEILKGKYGNQIASEYDMNMRLFQEIETTLASGFVLPEEYCKDSKNKVYAKSIPIVKR